MKVNLRPLYPATHKALSTLSETHGPEVWSILFGQLTLASQGPHSALSEPVPDWAENEDGFVEDKEDVGDEAVKCFRDPARKATEVRFGELLSGEGEDRLRAIAEVRSFHVLFRRKKTISDLLIFFGLLLLVEDAI